MFKVSVERVENIKPIEGADRLQLATIRGWDVVVSKTVQVDDSLVYFPIDAVLPEELENKIFEGSKVKLHNHRVRATKIRGVYSYGLTCPINMLKTDYKIGQDLSESLGVKKYEPEIKALPSKGKVGKPGKTNPNFFVYPKFYHYNDSKQQFEKTESFYAVEKSHGSSWRASWMKRHNPSILTRIGIKLGLCSEYEWCVGSHNVQRNPESNESYCNLARTYKLKEFLKDYPNWILFGEMIGDGIQANYSYGFKDHKLAVFDMIHLDGTHKTVQDVELIANRIGAIVPQRYVVKKEWVQNPEFGKSFIDGTTTIEGWVVRSVAEPWKKAKIINPEYLLNKNNTDFH